MDEIEALLIEDNAGDARLVKEHLREASGIRVNLHWCPAFAEGVEKLAAQPVDVVLLDLSLPDSVGLATLTRLAERFPRIPVVILTGHEDESTALRAMRHGAQDYLIKDQLSPSSLARAMRFAIERSRAMNAGGGDVHALAADLRRHLDVLRAEHVALARLVATPGGASAPRPVADVGETLQNRYVLDALLGRGSYGRAFRATDVLLDRQVVVKILHPGMADGAEGERQFVKEARLLAGLDHPRVVRVHDFGFHAKLPFYVMEYAEGGSLVDLLAPETGLGIERAVQIADQVLEGLEHIHARGVLHRDLKPANILLTQKGDAKLGDFGMALLRSENATAGSLVAGPSGGGTPAYAAPEILLAQPLSPASDIYGVGHVLFEMLTGKPHYVLQRAGRNEASRALKTALAGAPPNLAESLATLIREALDRQPAQRCQSAREMRERLSEAVAELNPGGTGGAIVPRR